MIETIMLIVVIFVLSGVFWYSFFYQKEKKLLNRLQQMLDCAIDGELESVRLIVSIPSPSRSNANGVL